MSKTMLFGRRAVMELLESGLEVVELLYSPGGHGKIISDIQAAARKRNIRIATLKRAELDSIASGENHQGIIAYYKKPKSLDVDELLASIDNGKERPIMILDGIEDPRNLGAIIRSVEVMGAGGVIMRKRRSADLTPVAVKASSGAALHLPVALTSNLHLAMRSLQDHGYWIYGLDAEAVTSIWDYELTGKIAFVLGAEGKGISRLLKKGCDELLRIPQAGRIASLNVSVSAALALGEWLRQNVRNIG